MDPNKPGSKPGQPNPGQKNPMRPPQAGQDMPGQQPSRPEEEEEEESGQRNEEEEEGKEIRPGGGAPKPGTGPGTGGQNPGRNR